MVKNRTENNISCYSKYNDVSYIREKLSSEVCVPCDDVVTDAEIMEGRIAPSYLGTFDKSIHDGVNPLCRRGVDFTQIGNILASVDAMESDTQNKITARRAELKQLDSTQSE